MHIDKSLMAYLYLLEQPKITPLRKKYLGTLSSDFSIALSISPMASS